MKLRGWGGMGVLLFGAATAGAQTTTTATATATTPATSAAATTTAPMAGLAAIANASALVTLAPGQTAILGFDVEGTVTRQVLIRAVSAGLAQFGVSARPALTALSVYQDGTLVARNSTWGTPISLTTTSPTTTTTSPVTTTSAPATTVTGTTTSAGDTLTTTGSEIPGLGLTLATNAGASPSVIAADAAAAGAFSLAEGSTDSAVVLNAPPGLYSVVVTSTGMGTAPIASTFSGTASGATAIENAAGQAQTLSPSSSETTNFGTSASATTTTATTGTAATSGTVLIEVYTLGG